MTELDLIYEMLGEMDVYVAEQYRARGALEVSFKKDPNDLLTEVDLEVQRRITKRIRAAFPGDGVIGEELDMDRIPDDKEQRWWIIDPIDGTQNFVRGMFPVFGVSIGFVADGQTQAGGVSMPIIEEVFLAERGQGATGNGQGISVSKVDSLDLARVEMDFGNADIREASLKAFGPILTQAGQVRTHCSAVVSLCEVATAACDAYLHLSLAPWDFCAATLIAEEAGARATDLDGAPMAVLGGRSSVVVTNGLIHEACLSKLSQ